MGDRIDWPRGGGDPFDGTIEWPGRFYWSHQMRSRVFPADEAPSADELYAAIPMGYTTLALLERVALYQDGRQEALWLPDAAQAVREPLQPFQLLLPPADGSGCRLLGASWPVRYALTDGEDLSKRTGGAVLVCRVLSHENWH